MWAHYRHKPNPVKAFMWPAGIGMALSVPKEFQEMLGRGDCIVEQTGDKKNLTLTVIKDPTPAMDKAIPGDWVVLDRDGKVRIMPVWLFKEYFEQFTPEPEPFRDTGL